MNKYLYNVTKQTLIEKAKVLVCAEDVNTAEKAIDTDSSKFNRR